MNKVRFIAATDWKDPRVKDLDEDAMLFMAPGIYFHHERASVIIVKAEMFATGNAFPFPADSENYWEMRERIGKSVTSETPSAIMDDIRTRSDSNTPQQVGIIEDALIANALIAQGAEELERIYNERTAGDYTFEGFLATFLTRVNAHRFTEVQKTITAWETDNPPS